MSTDIMFQTILREGTSRVHLSRDVDGIESDWSSYAWDEHTAWKEI